MADTFSFANTSSSPCAGVIVDAAEAVRDMALFRRAMRMRDAPTCADRESGDGGPRSSSSTLLGDAVM